MEKKFFRCYGIYRFHRFKYYIAKYSDFEFGLSKNIWYYNIINFLFYTFTSEKDNLNWEIRAVCVCDRVLRHTRKNLALPLSRFFEVEMSSLISSNHSFYVEIKSRSPGTYTWHISRSDVWHAVAPVLLTCTALGTSALRYRFTAYQWILWVV